MKFSISFFVIAFVALASFFGGSVDTRVPGWMTLQQAEAGAYRRSVRRTARRTSRRTSRRHGHYHGGAVVAGAAVATAIVVGTMVARLPPACSTLIVNGVTYHSCSGTYYVPRGSQWVVVEAP